MALDPNSRSRACSRVFPGSEADLGAVVCEVARHFMLQGYGVCALPARRGRWQLRITRSDVFAQSVPSGARCALSILLRQGPVGAYTRAQASLWPRQPLLTRITAALLWPWIGRSVWAMCEDFGLDQEAILAVQSSLGKRS